MSDSNTPSESIFVEGDLFLGRHEEQDQFRNILQKMVTPTGKDTQPTIVLLYGDGGIGKTTLARRFWNIATGEDQFAGSCHTLWLDWEDLRRLTPALQGAREQINPETVLDLIHKSAANQWGEKAFKQYTQAVAARIEAEKEAEKLLAQTEEKDERGVLLRGFTTTALAKLVRLSLPVGESGEAVVKTLLDAGIDMGAAAAAQLRQELTGRLQRRLKPEQYRLFMSPQEQLAQALGHDLAGLTQGWRGKPLLIVLDTYEIVDRTDIWVREVIKAAGSQVMWVISGRDDLVRSRLYGSVNFRGYADDFRQHVYPYNLGELALADVQRYFAHAVPERPLTEGDAAALTQATRGIPLAIREAADIWRAGASLEKIVGDASPTGSHEQLVERMTHRYLQYAIDNEADKIALYALALAGNDTDRLQAMLRPDNDAPFDLETRLRQLARAHASVHQQVFRLHDVAAQFILAYLRPKLRRHSDAVRKLNERAAAVLRHKLTKIEAVNLLIEERCDDADWLQAVLALADTLFWLDEDEAWRWFIPRYVEGMAYSQNLWQGLLQVVQPWQEQLSQTGQKRLKRMREAQGLVPELEQTESSAAWKGTLDEMDRLAKAGWMDGEGKEERLAILSWQRAGWLMEQKRYDEAAAALEQVEQTMPSSGNRLQQQLAESLFELATHLQWPDRTRFAVYSAKAELLLLKVAHWLPGRPQVWYRLGVAHSKAGQFEKAIVALQKSLNLAPSFAYPYHSLGIIYHQLGRYDEAITAYHHAIALDPHYFPPHSRLGSVYYEIGQYDEAITSYQQAIALAPQVAYSHAGLAYIYRKQGRYDDAKRAYLQAIALDPEYTYPLTGLGHLYAELGQYREAIDTYQQVLVINPKHVFSHNGLGNVYRMLGKYDEAIAEYKRAITNDPNYAYSYSGLGGVYCMLEQYKEATIAYQQAITLDPSLGFAHASLAACYRHLGEETSYQTHIDIARNQLTDEDVYNQACFEAICGNTTKAIALLKKALAHNQRLRDWIQRDPDFDFIRDDPRFQALFS